MIDLDFLSKAILTGILGALGSYFMFKLKRIESKLAVCIDKTEMRNYVQDKQEALNIQVQDLKDTSRRIEDKLDRIMEKL